LNGSNQACWNSGDKVARSAPGGGDYYLSYRIDDGVLTGLNASYNSLRVCIGLLIRIHILSGHSPMARASSDPVSGITFTQNSHTSTTANVSIATNLTDSQHQPRLSPLLANVTTGADFVFFEHQISRRSCSGSQHNRNRRYCGFKGWRSASCDICQRELKLKW